MSIRKNTYADIGKFRENRKKYNKKYYKRTAVYERRPWTEEEDELVLKHSITDTELSKLIKRSVKSIQVRRTRLKKAKEIDQS